VRVFSAWRGVKKRIDVLDILNKMWWFRFYKTTKFAF